MFDGYQLPAIVLTALLLPVFLRLYLRSRDSRTLLWLLGFLCAVLRMLQVYPLGLWDFSQATVHPWISSLGLTAALVGSAFFLASLAPQAFRLGTKRILYAIPFTIPLAAYAILLDGIYHGQPPASIVFLIFPALGALSLFVACIWAFANDLVPRWIGLSLCVLMGGASLWICVSVRGSWPLVFVESALHLTTALLVFFVFRRVTSGTVLSGLGFLGWSLSIGIIAPAALQHPLLLLSVLRISSMGKVAAAVGMIVLTLEDQLSVKQTAQDRERRARNELEAYTKVVLSRRRLEDFDRQTNLICQTVVTHSRFAQAGLMLLQPSGQFRLVGTAGFDDAALNAIESLVARISGAGFLAPGAAPPAAEKSQSMLLNLEPWLLPGDDLERLRLTEMVATPLNGRSAPDGALLLAGLRDPDQPLRADDLFPVEVLAARIQAARSQTMMLEKLVDAEKFAGLGQLANNVTRQLNNPLTVILGYASLLEVTPSMSPQERKGVEAILSEARNMRSTLESLSRMSRSQTEQFTAVSVTEMLNDMEQLHRSEFVHRSIDFRLQVAPALPRALGNAQQVRQAVLYCLQFAIEAVENLDSPTDKSVRIEATSEGDYVKILIAHSGPGFLHPTRAFDPFVPAQAAGETAGLGLSLCATILRENNGRISAVNFEPRGAGIVLELQTA
ncbi:MAG: histidine kinase dimerization/phospho-acceptor domain-containing protein [Terracidiphilus sp.]